MQRNRSNRRIIMKKFLISLFIVASVHPHSANLDQQQVVKPAKVDPLSKITITSKRAIGKKDKSSKSAFIFSYLDDVKTVFADGSTITAQQLDINLDRDGIATQEVVSSLTKEVRHDKLSQFKKIAYSKNVVINRDNQKIIADRAELDPQKRCCLLEGNVKVIQKKSSASDVPLHLSSNKAILSLETGSVSFVGSSSNPVSTVIDIAGMDLLAKKDNAKKKKREQNQHSTRT